MILAQLISFLPARARLSAAAVDLQPAMGQLQRLIALGNVDLGKGLRRGSGNPPRAWQRMLSGRRLDLLDPSPLDIEIEDIAHGLARVARWNGQTTGADAFSVAQHSVIVEEIAAHVHPGLDTRWRLAALLHDAAEYVIGDMISPFKAALGYDYKAFEERLETAIHVRFGLPPKMPADVKKLIKVADRACAYFEAVQLAGFKPLRPSTGGLWPLDRTAGPGEGAGALFGAVPNPVRGNGRQAPRPGVRHGIEYARDPNRLLPASSR
jgi:5'-deoxynucleotidase YfbR-like HD superfamily hydrolase